MKTYLHALQWVHKLSALLFGLASLVLLVLATHEGWQAIAGGIHEASAVQVIEAVGLMAAAVVALQISETIVEEEILRDEHVSAPTRVRRYLSRFFVVVLVSLAVEGLVATFKALHEDMAQLGSAAALIAATALLLAGWGAFVFLNRSAEELEPEAMERAKAEDAKIE